MPIADLGSLTARINLDTTPLAAGAVAARGELGALEASGSNSLNRLASVGKAAFLGLSAAGFAVGAVSLKMASDFQSSMLLIRTQAGASQAEVNKMSQAILDMAVSVGTSPKKLSEALFHIESAGLRGAEALHVLRIAAQGAKVGQADLESVTNALVAVTTSHIGGVHSQAEAMGVLNAIIGVGNMRMDDLAGAIGTGILPVAKTFGLSLQDVGAAMAVLTDQAVPAEVAANRLRMTFALMAAHTPEAKAALKSIGIESTDLAEAMRNGGIVEAIGLLKRKLDESGLSATESAQLLVKAFGGGETSGTILTLLGNFESLKEKQAGIAAGAGKFSENWEATKQTFKFQMDQMKASAEVLGIKIGTFLIPIVLKLVKALEATVDWLMEHKVVAAALAAVIGGALLAAIGVWVGGMIAANAVALAVGAAIAVLVAGFVLAYQKIGPFRDAVDAVGSILSNLWTQLGYARDAFHDAGLGSNEFAQTIDNIFGNTGRLIPLIQTLGSAFAGVGQAIARAIQGLGNSFGDFAGFFRDIAPQVQEAIGHILNVIKIALAPIVFIWKQWGDDIKQIVRNVWEVLGSIINAAFDVIKAIVQNGIRIIRDIIVLVLALINGDWGKAWDALKDIVDAVWDTIYAVIRGAWDMIFALLKGAVKILGNIFDGAWDAVYAGVVWAFTKVIDFFKALPGRILGFLTALPGVLLRAGIDLMTGLFNGVQFIWQAVFNFIKSLPSRILSAVVGIGDWLFNAGLDLIQGLLNGIIKALEFLPEVVRKFLGLNAVISGLKNAVDQLQGAKINITAEADTAQAQAALDRMALTIAKFGPFGNTADENFKNFPRVPVPAAQHGGLFSRPQTISIAEMAKPELVLPLAEPDRARALLAKHGGGLMGGQSSSTTWNVNIDRVEAPDPAELQRKLEAIARVQAMKGAA